MRNLIYKECAVYSKTSILKKKKCINRGYKKWLTLCNLYNYTDDSCVSPERKNQTVNNVNMKTTYTTY